MKNTTLTLAMIVKNEASNLGECLASVERFVDQIVIVDTGSKDNTLEIARQFDAEIYQSVWQNDFAEARNESIKHARGDWILWMDADERLLPESASILKKLLKNENEPVAYNVKIQNLQKDQETFIMSDGHRLFTNNQGIYFSGRIHEQISPSIKELDGEIRDSQIVLLHLGYSYTGEKEKRKNTRNRLLLKKMVSEDPDNAYSHYKLGQFYALNKEHEKSIEHYKIAYNLNQLTRGMTASLLNSLAEELYHIENYRDSRNYVQKSLALVKNQVGGFYLLYRLANEEKHYLKAIEYLEKILKNSHRIKTGGKQISTDIIIEKDKIFCAIAGLYSKKGNWKSAYKYYFKAFDYKKSGQNLKKVYRTAIKMNDQGKIKNLYKYIDVFAKTDLDFLQKLGIYLIKKKWPALAIRNYEKIMDLDSQNTQALKRLAGLYAKIGQLDRAQSMVKRLKAQHKAA